MLEKVQEILTKTYYNNTIQQWLISLLIVLGVAIVGKLLYWIITKFIKAFTHKTKNRLDDIIIDMAEEPLVFAMVLGGIWYAAGILTLTESARVFIDHAFQFLIVINITWLLTRLFESLYEEYMVPMAEKSESDVDDQLFPIIRKGVKGIVWTLGIIVGLNNAGYNVGAILTGLGIGGIALAMAAKETVSNMFGGITIFIDKMFKIKDRIVVNDVEGVVEEIGLRSTKIRKLDGRLVTVPNSKFTNNEVENVSSEPSRKVILTLGISCDSEPEKIQKAIKISEKVLEKNKNLLKKNTVFFSGFGNFTYDIMVIYYIKKGADIAQTKTEVNLEIVEQFNKNNIEMPYPTQTILNKNI
jgi:MscS family membrane protein